MPIEEVPVSQPELRAADTDRAAVAGLLGDALHEGRLTVQEYDDRVQAAYAARTHGDLALLTADLPAARPGPADQPGTGAGDEAPDDEHDDLRGEWRNWLFTAVLVWCIYLATSLGTGGFLYPWPIWVVGPWGAVLLARTLTTRGSLSRR